MQCTEKFRLAGTIQRLRMHHAALHLAGLAKAAPTAACGESHLLFSLHVAKKWERAWSISSVLCTM